jgi:hypothetical protein
MQLEPNMNELLKAIDDMIAFLKEEQQTAPNPFVNYDAKLAELNASRKLVTGE